MHTALRLTISAAFLAVCVQSIPANTIGVEPSLARIATAHAFTFRTDADAALTEWALARFERAGLQLPPLAIAFHDDKKPCDGQPGLFRSSTPTQIDICGFNRNRFLVTPKKTILHELGHAWAQLNLTNDIRERFLHLRGLDTWADEKTPWEEKVSEHAAEVIAWALIDQELLMTTIRNADPETLAQAYELLTSTEPPSWGRTPVTVMGDVSPEDESLVYWAVGRFRDAGLALPKVEIVFDPTSEACEGASGRFIAHGAEMRVALCTRQQGMTLTNRVAILHELGHAWLTHSVSERVQITFLDMRDLEAWNDRNQAWNLRGAEHAADIIAWALMDQEVWMYRIRPNDFDSLQAGFQLLTGKQPVQRLEEKAAPVGRHLADRLDRSRTGKPND